MTPIRLRLPGAPRILARLLQAGLSAADPKRVIRRAVTRRGARLRIGRRTFDLRRIRRLVVVGAGKASGQMAAALEARLGSALKGGLVVTVPSLRHPRTRRIDVVEAGHPLPDQTGARAAVRMLTIARDLTHEDLLCVLLSGGASSLLPAPAPGLTLRDISRVTNGLLRCGAPIEEINIVRKHLSSISGGRLAAATRARVVTLVLSDVIGDDLSTIGSGLTAPDPSTFRQACRILRARQLWHSLPVRVRTHLTAGVRGKREDTPKPGSPIFRRVSHHVLGNNQTALRAVAQAARRAGLRVSSFHTPFVGDVGQSAHAFAVRLKRLARHKEPIRRPACLLAGGEVTVRVTGRGRGGRAQEFALAGASTIAGLKNVWVAAMGTDGRDGPTDAAGAIVNGETLEKACRLQISVTGAKRRNDSYTFFKKVGGHLVTGPTGTNVNDLYLGLAL